MAFSSGWFAGVTAEAAASTTPGFGALAVACPVVSAVGASSFIVDQYLLIL
jgi:hypothetical protein